MATNQGELEVPSWVAGVIASVVFATAAYIFIYGGEPTTPGLVVLGSVSLGLGLFTLYLFYRFVIAVEKIADKY